MNFSDLSEFQREELWLEKQRNKQMSILEENRQTIWISEILEEASAYGLRNEVDLLAKNLIESNLDLDTVAAYQLALQDCIK